MAGRPEDPFAPPEDSTGGASGEGGPGAFELARDTRRAPSPVAGDPGEPQLPDPRQVARQPVAYKQPPGGVGNFLIWILAAVGLGAAILFGASVLKRGVESHRSPVSTPGATIQAAPSAAAQPPKPVTWKPVETGDVVLVTIEASPRSARLLLDGAPLPSNPVQLQRGKSHTITAMAAGFEPASAEVVARDATTVRLKLKKAR